MLNSKDKLIEMVFDLYWPYISSLMIKSQIFYFFFICMWKLFMQMHPLLNSNFLCSVSISFHSRFAFLQIQMVFGSIFKVQMEKIIKVLCCLKNLLNKWENLIKFTPQTRVKKIAIHCISLFCYCNWWIIFILMFQISSSASFKKSDLV